MPLHHAPCAAQGEVRGKGDGYPLLISDIHAGKQVYDDQGRCLYNRDTCAFRLALLRDKVTKLLKDHIVLENVDEFVICLIGDIVDGSGIYPGQELNQDITGFSNQISLVTAAIWDLVKKIRGYCAGKSAKGVSLRESAAPCNGIFPPHSTVIPAMGMPAQRGKNLFDISFN